MTAHENDPILTEIRDLLREVRDLAEIRNEQLASREKPWRKRRPSRITRKPAVGESKDTGRDP